MSADGVFNEIVHAPLRLRICGLLRSVDELDFALVRDTRAPDIGDFVADLAVV